MTAVVEPNTTVLRPHSLLANTRVTVMYNEAFWAFAAVLWTSLVQRLQCEQLAHADRSLSDGLTAIRQSAEHGRRRHPHPGGGIRGPPVFSSLALMTNFPSPKVTLHKGQMGARGSSLLRPQTGGHSRTPCALGRTPLGGSRCGQGLHCVRHQRRAEQAEQGCLLRWPESCYQPEWVGR